MTFNQLTELVKHIEEEHNFFNRQSCKRIVKSITPSISLQRAGAVTAIDLEGYGWRRFIEKEKDCKDLSMFNLVMEILDTPEDTKEAEI